MAVAMIVAIVIAGCGGGGDTTAGLPASPAGKADAADFEGVHSGEVEVVLEVRRVGKKPELVKMRTLGVFMKAGEEALPQVDVAIESNGELAGRNIEFLSGPLLRADKWVVNFDGKVYEPDQASYEELKSKLEEAQEEEGGPGNAMACVEAAEGFSLTEALDKVSFEGKGETIDGVKLETVGADLDVPAVIDELNALTEESPGCKAQLQAVGLPSSAELEALKKELKDNLISARLSLSIDKHGVVRSLRILGKVEEPHGEELEIEVTMRLEQVNEVTELPITHGYSPYPALLKQFGLNEQDVQQADAGEIYVGILGVLANRLFGRETG